MDKALKKLLELKNVYQEKEEFQVGEALKVKVQLLTSEEETEVHTYAVQFEQGISYLYAVKRETLAKCIHGMNGTDIPDLVDTDEGKIQRHIWLRESIISGWSQLLVDQVWNVYAILIEKAEAKITFGISKEETEEDE